MTEFFVVSLTVKKCLHVNKNPNSSHQRNDNKICGIYLIKERESIKNYLISCFGWKTRTDKTQVKHCSNNEPGRVNEQSWNGRSLLQRMLLCRWGMPLHNLCGSRLVRGMEKIQVGLFFWKFSWKFFQVFSIWLNPQVRNLRICMACPTEDR